MNRVIVYDSSAHLKLRIPWMTYANLNRVSGWKVVPAKTWTGAHDGISALYKDGGYTDFDEIQFWHHGQPGFPLFGGKFDAQALLDLCTYLHDRTLVWFRACSVFYGKEGLKFATSTADLLRCRVAGHTRVIGPLWQSGLYSVSWDRGSGRIVWDKEAHAEWTKNLSDPSAPRTIPMYQMAFPKGW